jgi:hypothetical protein
LALTCRTVKPSALRRPTSAATLSLRAITVGPSWPGSSRPDCAPSACDRCSDPPPAPWQCPHASAPASACARSWPPRRTRGRSAPPPRSRCPYAYLAEPVVVDPGWPRTAARAMISWMPPRGGRAAAAGPGCGRGGSLPCSGRRLAFQASVVKVPPLSPKAQSRRHKQDVPLFDHL